MAKSENTTKATEGDVSAFLAGVEDEQRRADAQLLVELMCTATGDPPVLWGTSIVGFGSRHYRYRSGREGDTPAVAFSPRKAQLVLYLTGALEEYKDLLAKLGRHRTGKGCLYLKSVDEIDRDVLREIVLRSQRLARAA